VEVLSPAGSFEALQAAVHSGADAVYVGGARFSARKHAQNFTDDELLQAVDFCHLRGVKLYLCCNTLMKDSELCDVMDFVRYAYKIGVDALIVQDLGLIARIRQELPDFPVHASTQMTAVNAEGVRQLAELGVKRVVLARELSAKQIAEVRRYTDMELEVFVHGALCMSYSGQCLMSSMLGGRSGNRGGCAQPCRLPYTLLKNGKPITGKKALLCPKDLCLADRIEELKALGVTSLKIEGRMKSPSYVAMVTRVYKQALCGGVSQKEIDDMLKFFSRGGSCNGYFDGCAYQNMMDAGTGTKIAESLPEIAKRTKKMPVYISFKAETGAPLLLSMTNAEGVRVQVEGAVCQQAHTTPTSAERMKEQLEKLGETAFVAEETVITASEDAVVPIKEINALRREAAQTLEERITGVFRRTLPEPAGMSIVQSAKKAEPVLCAEVQTRAQFEAVAKAGIKRVYIPDALWELRHLVQEPVLQAPPISRAGEKLPLAHDTEVCVQNIGQIALCNNATVTAGHRLNLTNGETAEQLKKWNISAGVISPELNMRSITKLRQHTDLALEAIIYGRVPLMLLENCVIRCNAGCVCDSASFSLLDRKNEEFPILPLKCGNVIYNAKPLYMADRMAEVRALGLERLRMCFTTEDADTCKRIIRDYQRALAGESLAAPKFGFTRGHFYRGMQ